MEGTDVQAKATDVGIAPQAGDVTASSGPVFKLRGKAQVLVVMGMAGSGKTTFVNRLQMTLKAAGLVSYIVNLDPAVRAIPYPTNIDIRDTINYKDVMRDYKLGPNGAIMTCLNLYATRFDQVMELMEARADEVDYFILDTPGQIEVFNWSASGTLILQCLSTSFPTYIMYITDSKRCQVPTSFSSSMLYCCSVLYKSDLPLLCVFNKSDVADPSLFKSWMTEYDAYCDASGERDDGETYMATLSKSTMLTMLEFYEDIDTVQLSSATGEGFSELLEAMPHLRKDFQEIYDNRVKRFEEEKKKPPVKMEAPSESGDSDSLEGSL